MRKNPKRAVAGLLLAVSYLLCLSPPIFAAGPVDTAIVADLPVIAEIPDRDASRVSVAEAAGRDTAATGDEFLDWMEEHKMTEGVLELTADITIDDFYYVRPSDAPLIVDTGEFSITIAGHVEIYCRVLTIRGQGGGNGIIQVPQTGCLYMNSLILKAEDGYAVVQEDGSGLAMEQCTISGEVCYADAPFVWEWNFTLALVERGQTAEETLPGTVKANVSRMGKLAEEDVPVVWDLSGNGTCLDQRLRFTAKGIPPNFAFLIPPTCTVVYNDFPFTFTRIKTREEKWSYVIKADFTTQGAKFPIEVVQEYSFDGKNWSVMGSCIAASSRLDFNFYKYQEADGIFWDAESNPWLYIRMYWRDGETECYSNILRFSGENFGEAEDIGGNRGGGTDISKPPALPDPTPDPQGTPDGGEDGGGTSSTAHGSDTGWDGSSGQGNVVPAPESYPESRPARTPFPSSSPEISKGLDPAEVWSGGTAAQTAPKQGEETNDGAKPGRETADGTRQSEEAGGETEQDMESVSGMGQDPEMLYTDIQEAPSGGVSAASFAVGCMAVAAVMGAAGFYLYPQACRRLLKRLQEKLLRK